MNQEQTFDNVNINLLQNNYENFIMKCNEIIINVIIQLFII